MAEGHEEQQGAYWDNRKMWGDWVPLVQDKTDIAPPALVSPIVNSPKKQSHSEDAVGNGGEGFAHTHASKHRHTYAHTRTNVQLHKLTVTHAYAHTHARTYTQPTRQTHLPTCAPCRDLFRAAAATVFLQLNWMNNAQCENLLLPGECDSLLFR